MPLLEVKVLTKREDNLLSKFLDQLGKTNISVLAYHFPFYRDVLEKSEVGKPLYFGCWQNEKLIGVLPGFIKESDLGIVYSSMPFFGPNAGVLCDYFCDNSQIIHTTLINSVLSYLANHSDPISASFYTPFNRSDFDFYSNSISSTLSIIKHTLYLPLAEYKLNAKTRYDVKKSQNYGVKISTDVTTEKVRIFNSIYEKNCEDYCIPQKPYKVISQLASKSYKCKKIRFYFAEYNKKIIAGLLVLWGVKTASYYIPCSLHEYRYLQASSLLINYAMTDTKKNGLNYWNWESSPSTDSGVYKFKKKWGSTESEYRLFIKIFKKQAFFEHLGKNKIADRFPYFFVYPFYLLDTYIPK